MLWLVLWLVVLAQVAPSADLAIVNVSVIPMTGAAVVPGQTVLIRDGRIAEVGARVVVPGNTSRIDGTGKYLIPGLVDSHVHLQFDESVNPGLLTLFLLNGVTTVLNLHGAPSHVALRSEVARGQVLGPRIFTSGPGVGAPHGQTPTSSAHEMEREVARQKRAGYDVLKLHGDFTREAYGRVMAAARREGLRVVGHAPRNLGVAPMLEERQPAVAHLEEYLYVWKQNIAALATATAKAGSAVISTLAVYRGIAEQISDLDGVLKRKEVSYVPRSIGGAWGWWPPNNTYVRRFTKKDVPLFRSNYGRLEQLTAGFQRAGVLLLAGTDTPTAAVVPGFSIHDELQDLVKAGLTPFEALRAATVNPARFLGSLPESGTIERGKRADCVLLKSNPLEEIANTAAIAGVIRNGRWIGEQEIRARLKELADGGQYSYQSR